MDIQKIGSFLAVLRKEQKLTQEQLGQKLGVTNKTISRWENGNYLPPVEMLKAIGELYGISMNELLSGERLETENYREKAEENIVTVLSQSSFTLKEKIAYYKKKWLKEHIGTFIAGILIAAVFYIAGAVWHNGLLLVGYLWCIGFLLVQNNRMMAYTEERAFDGTGSQ